MIFIEEEVRRIELNFRINFPYLDNELYCIEEHHYAIYCKNYSLDQVKLKKFFEEDFRPIGYFIELVFEKPSIYLHKVNILEFSNVVNNFNGEILTEPEMNTFVRSLLWDVDIISVKVLDRGLQFAIEIKVSKLTDDKKMEEIKDKITAKKLGCDRIIIVKSETEIENKIYENNDEESIVIKKEFPFILKEHEQWYELAPDIYRGELNRSNIDFFPSATDTSACYINCSLSYEQINLRCFLVMFDIVYITPPRKEKFDDFLIKQRITLEELIGLASLGKIVFLLTENENVFSSELIKEVYNINQLAIIGQKGINIIVATYLNELKCKYRKIIPNIDALSLQLMELADKTNDGIINRLAKFIAWPLYGTLESFSNFNLSSTGSLAYFGLLNIFLDLDNPKDYSLNHQFKLKRICDISVSAYIATSFKAIYVPTIDNQLNDVDSLVNNKVASALKIFTYTPKKNNELDEYQLLNSDLYLRLFDFKTNISSVKVAERALKYNSPLKFRSLINNLGAMDEEDRLKQCKLYNDVLCDLTQLPDKHKVLIKKMMLGTKDFIPIPDVLAYGLNLVGLLLDSYHLTDEWKEEAEKSRIKEALKNYNVINNHNIIDDVYILDKMSSIVNLK